MIDFILSGSDRFIIAYFMTPIAVGYYAPAYVLGSLIIIFPKMLGASLPQIIALSSDSGDTTVSKILIEKSIKMFLILSLPFIVGSYMLSKPLLNILANAQVANEAYLVTPIVAIGILFYGLNYILSNTVIYLKMKNSLIFYSNIIAAILNIILNFVLLYLFRNILIAAITTLFSYLIAFLFINYNTQKLMVINYNFKNVIRMIFASFIMGLFLMLFKEFFISKVLMLTILIPLSTAIYFLLIFFFKVITKNELQYFFDFFKKKFKKEVA